MYFLLYIVYFYRIFKNNKMENISVAHLFYVNGAPYAWRTEPICATDTMRGARRRMRHG
jgi:hypothetical protein